MVGREVGQKKKETRRRINNFDNQIKRELELLKKSKLSKKNKELILNYKKYAVARSLSKPRIMKYIYCMRHIADEFFDIDFDKADKKYIEGVVAGIVETKRFKEWTKWDYKMQLKLFYRWLKDYPKKKYPPEVDWIETKQPKPEIYLDKDLLNHKDIKKMIDVSDHPQTKALIATLFNSMGRIEEIATLSIGDVEFDDYGAQIHIKYSKTGHPRTTRLVFASPYLRTWLHNYHPLRNDETGPLWVGISNKNKDKAINYGQVYSLLRRTAKKAGITKAVNPHFFRKSFCSYASNYLTPSQLSAQGGWVVNSDSLRTYIHGTKGADTASIKMQGGKIKEDKELEAVKDLQPRVCERCELVNEATNRFCGRCSAPLDLKTAISVDKAQSAGGKLTTLIAKYPKKADLILNRLEKIINKSVSK